MHIMYTYFLYTTKSKYEFSYLPPFCTFPRKFCKYDTLLRMFLLMLFTTCLYKESICCHSTARFRILTLSSAHLCSNLIILICILRYMSLILDIFYARKVRNYIMLHFIPKIYGSLFRQLICYA